GAAVAAVVIAAPRLLLSPLLLLLPTRGKGEAKRVVCPLSRTSTPSWEGSLESRGNVKNVSAGSSLVSASVGEVWKDYFSCFNKKDPFADASKGDDLLPAGTEDYIHIRIQQRNGRKTLTTVQGIADDYDKKKLVKAFKKKFACNGTVIEHPEYGEVIQLQGDQRKNICQFLIEIGLAKDDQLKVHGF
uniref:Eukaryotic translation initiation factor 1 n=1 Tax=Naja naja TaxID=35670 RepID=A0A8C6VIQ7_NAJNA